MSETNYVTLWNRCLQIIKDNVPPQTYKTWFLPIVPLKYEDKTLVLQVPSQFFYEFLEEQFIDLLRQSILKVFGEGSKLMYNVMVVNNPPTTVPLPTHPDHTTTTTAKPQVKEVPQQPLVTQLDSHLKGDYNFETFIEGESNKLSRSVAEAVALNPAKTIFNPLFIYGASGVGKTHLVNAIGTKIKELYPDKRVLYVSALLFQVQYTDSVRNNTVNDFINFYQTIDVLIIDDTQEFAGVTKTQNTFFHIFDELHRAGKQLILTSDRSPADLKDLEERLLTRFRWGLSVEMQVPDFETRLQIARFKARKEGFDFSDEILACICKYVDSNIRELEGAMNSLLAQTVFTHQDLTPQMVQDFLGKMIKDQKPEMTVERREKVVCDYFNIEPEVLQSKTRKREIVQARQLAMYFCKNYTNASLAYIGKQIGRKDHTTVLYACKAVADLLETDRTFRSQVEELQQKLYCRS